MLPEPGQGECLIIPPLTVCVPERAECDQKHTCFLFLAKRLPTDVIVDFSTSQGSCANYYPHKMYLYGRKTKKKKDE